MTEANAEIAAKLGEPSYVWRAGQQRRLEMILSAAEGRQRGWVLDNGCGLGLYLQRLGPGAERAFGLELDRERARRAAHSGLTVVSALGEQLPFPEGVFDLVLSHEVLEHVRDDQAALAEIVRILRRPEEGVPAQGGDRDPGAGRKPGAERGPSGRRAPQAGEVRAGRAGRLVLFTPNRGYPFETHGMYLRGRYRFGNIPLINYLPRRLRDRLAPHVRVYTGRDLQRLIQGLPVRVVRRTIIFGAYDNLIQRWGFLGRIVRGVLQALERTPLCALGLSHFWVLERI
jgi:SAM-dependent methyltransferase